VSAEAGKAAYRHEDAGKGPAREGAGGPALVIESTISTEQLIHAAGQLSDGELDAFVDRLLALRGHPRPAAAATAGRDYVPTREAKYGPGGDRTLDDLAAQVRASGRRIFDLNPGAVRAGSDFDDPLPDAFWLGEE